MLIRPCAYCWGDSAYPQGMGVFDNRGWRVLCGNEECCAEGGFHKSEEEAVRAWNAVTDAVKVRLSPHSEEYVRACR